MAKVASVGGEHDRWHPGASQGEHAHATKSGRKRKEPSISLFKNYYKSMLNVFYISARHSKLIFQNKYSTIRVIDCIGTHIPKALHMKSMNTMAAFTFRFCFFKKCKKRAGKEYDNRMY